MSGELNIPPQIAGGIIVNRGCKCAQFKEERKKCTSPDKGSVKFPSAQKTFPRRGTAIANFSPDTKYKFKRRTVAFRQLRTTFPAPIFRSDGSYVCSDTLRSIAASIAAFFPV